MIVNVEQRRTLWQCSSIVGGCVLLVSLFGCSDWSSSRAPSAAIDPADGMTEVEVDRRKQVWINNTLAEAEMALVSNRLMRPKGDNAYSRYREVLAIEPDNVAAKIGVKRISRRYLVLAKEAYDNSSYQRADDFLSRSEQLQPDYVGAEALRRYFARNKVTGVNEYLLKVSDLTARDDEIKRRIEAIAVLAGRWQSRLLIVSRDDAEGRWIYLQLKQGAMSYRFNANIERGESPRIILLDQPLQ